MIGWRKRLYLLGGYQLRFAGLEKYLCLSIQPKVKDSLRLVDELELANMQVSIAYAHQAAKIIAFVQVSEETGPIVVTINAHLSASYCDLPGLSATSAGIESAAITMRP